MLASFFAGAPVSAGVSSRASGSYLLTATSTGGNYAPTFTGNGYIGARVPPTGQGYAGGSTPTESTLAGFYAQAPGQVQQRANLPAWSALTFSDGGQDFSLGTGQVSGWRQQLDLHTGVITTTATWTAPDGHTTALRYDVFTDRARPQVAVVRLALTPQWSGTATVTDLIDGTPATLTTGLSQGRDLASRQDWESIQTMGTDLIAALASRAIVGTGAANVTDAAVTGGGPQTVGQRLSFGVTQGQTYTVTKYVGIAKGGSGASAIARARQQSSAAASAGFGAALARNVLHGLAWHGRRFTVAIGPRDTRVSLLSGPALPVTAGSATHTVPPGGSLTIPTRRPDREPTADLVRCQPATASSSQLGADPLAAVDGSPATGWQPQQIAASFTVPLRHEAAVSSATVLWGREWPPQPAPNVHPPPGPVKALRASSYDLVVSVNGHDWTVAASVQGRTTGTRDVLTFAPVRARYVGLRISDATNGTPPILEELTVPGH
jgi:Glycosyl hydrolase family 65, N-terminal domain/NedA-like, galactose-binding domain